MKIKFIPTPSFVFLVHELIPEQLISEKNLTLKYFRFQIEASPHFDDLLNETFKNLIRSLKSEPLVTLPSKLPLFLN